MWNRGTARRSRAVAGRSGVVAKRTTATALVLVVTVSRSTVYSTPFRKNPVAVSVPVAGAP